MARRKRPAPSFVALQRRLNALARKAARTGTKVMTRALKHTLAQTRASAPRTARRSSTGLGARPKKTPSPRHAGRASGTAVGRTPAPAASRSTAGRRSMPTARSGAWSTGLAVALGAARHYLLYTPRGVRRTERLPLLVVLHGCHQDAETIAAISGFNRVAARARCLVLYPEQDRLANMQGCWNWYQTRTGRAQVEAAVIEAAIEAVCRSAPVDRTRIALAGLSAGASMAAIVAARRPERYAAVAMHSGVAPGLAHSATAALRAMRGRLRLSAPMAPTRTPLPPLLVIHGSVDAVVAPSNGLESARRWAAHAHARAGRPRGVQRGTRLAARITDFRVRGRLAARLCEVQGLGHAWSGGAPGRAYSDPRGPDAARMILAFASAAFAARAA